MHACLWLLEWKTVWLHRSIQGRSSLGARIYGSVLAFVLYIYYILQIYGFVCHIWKLEHSMRSIVKIASIIIIALITLSILKIFTRLIRHCCRSHIIKLLPVMDIKCWVPLHHFLFKYTIFCEKRHYYLRFGSHYQFVQTWRYWHTFCGSGIFQRAQAWNG